MTRPCSGHGCEIGPLGNWVRRVEDHLPVSRKDGSQALARVLEGPFIEPHIQDHREIRCQVKEADGQAGVFQCELSHEDGIPGRPCPIAQGDQLIERIAVGIADGVKSAEIAWTGDQGSTHLTCLSDAASHHVTVEDDERRDLATPCVQHVAAAEGLLLARMSQSPQHACVGARQDPCEVGTD